MSILTIVNIHKQFEDGLDVLHGIDLQVGESEIVCLLGPSGCGKTTLLRIVAGLETPDRGRVVFDGRDMQGVPVHRRGFGLMFQDFALFPHKNVWANVAFGLRMQGLPRAEIEERVNEALALVNLSDLARRDVYQLSGGERQRVALARSLAPRPRLLLLDEPLGSLDRTLRDRLLQELRNILKQVNVTTIYVTHDQAEAFAIADRVVLMNEGRIVQSGRPEEVYQRPANAWAARFLGMHNLIAGQWIAPGVVDTAIGKLSVAGCGEGPLTVLIRPEAAHIVPSSKADIEGILAGLTFLGTLTRIVVRCAGGTSLILDLPARDVPSPGQPIALSLSREGIICLDEAQD